MDKHFTATTYIFDENKPRTLLHWHKKLQCWLPPGGHIEKNETPMEAAKREVMEEAGLTDLQFVQNGVTPERIDERCEILPMPHFLLSEEIEQDHYHLDWIYFAFVNPIIFKPKHVDDEFKWFTKSSLINEHQIFDNVKEIALRGFDKLYET